MNKNYALNIDSETALNLLKVGNQRFVNNLLRNKDVLQQINVTRDGQSPFAAVLSCIDSRTSAELIFDQGLGDILSIRIAGNILNDDIIGSLEFATFMVGVKIIVVLGHTKCGAIIEACNNNNLGKFTGLLNKIKPAIAHETETLEYRVGTNPQFVYNVTVNNIVIVIDEILKQSDIIQKLCNENKIKIVGGIYNIDSGEVNFF